MDEKMMICPECAGSRKINNMDMVEIICPACNGTGKVSACIPVPSTPAKPKQAKEIWQSKPLIDARNNDGTTSPLPRPDSDFNLEKVVCPSCKGAGGFKGYENEFDQMCENCNGTGKVPVPSTPAKPKVASGSCDIEN